MKLLQLIHNKLINQIVILLTIFYSNADFFIHSILSPCRGHYHFLKYIYHLTINTNTSVSNIRNLSTHSSKCRNIITPSHTILFLITFYYHSYWYHLYHHSYRDFLTQENEVLCTNEFVRRKTNRNSILVVMIEPSSVQLSRNP